MNDFQAMAETIERAESIIRATHGADDVANDLYALGCQLGHDTTYNGWTNYPTWAVNLWLSNDEPLYRETTAMVEGIKETPIAQEDPATVRYTVADVLRQWVSDELAPDLGASFAADLHGYALDQVDWFEIADAWLEQVQEAELA